MRTECWSIGETEDGEGRSRSLQQASAPNNYTDMTGARE